jgi:hypothetical protein
MNEAKILGFYRKKKKETLIDIEIAFYREIYNSWDFSPELNRDLDDDLFEYLEECCREIPPKSPICIVLHLPEAIKNPQKELLNKKSFENYFSYRIKKLQFKKKKMYKNAVLYAAYGLIFISLATLMEHFIPESTVLSILEEGFFIGGWVLFWELFSMVFFHKGEVREMMNILRRLKNAPIEYEYKTK